MRRAPAGPRQRRSLGRRPASHEALPGLRPVLSQQPLPVTRRERHSRFATANPGRVPADVPRGLRLRRPPTAGSPPGECLEPAVPSKGGVWGHVHVRHPRTHMCRAGSLPEHWLCRERSRARKREMAGFLPNRHWGAHGKCDAPPRHGTVLPHGSGGLCVGWGCPFKPARCHPPTILWIPRGCGPPVTVKNRELCYVLETHVGSMSL